MSNVLAKQYVEQSPKQTKRPFVLGAVMLAMFMAAIEATIVSTAMPVIVSSLGGFSQYSWVFSSYLLMNAVTVLIYGKLADLFGRKPVIMFGIIVFLIGSLLCGMAESMTMLIVFRFIQGFGAGAVMPIATTIVGDLYTKEERAKIQGYLSSVWGISAILGPALGGFFVAYMSWKWVFWINIPLGILSLLVLFFYLNEDIEKTKRSIDYAGAIFLIISVTSFMLVLVEGGVRFSWTSPQIIGLLSVFIFTFVLFIWQEKRAKEPVMPFNIWKERPILIANIVSLTTGVILIGLSTFLPTYVQGIMGESPLVAGFTLTTMSIGWPIAATIAGKLMLSIGFRMTSVMGGVSLILGSGVFATLTPNDGPLWAAFGSFLIGVGMGLSSTAFIVLIQSTVDWKQRGIATASNMFMRNLGSTIGAALLGGILNIQMKSYIEQSGIENVNVDTTNVLLNPKMRETLSASVRTVLQDGLTNALHQVYLVVGLFAVISFLFILLLPKKESR
ncbi:MDR family MFS transporter [Bacillus sp. CGMCC 1.16541]|uniref:MDR family MFS transporter n=1 Tax=Bacillus sp. CGMCC 1.16541 TaxID=2185143 RepID=UPI0023B7F524|nr:MDR family MFS transporter [Bacillus sp. CGMCC 1.16541]